MSIMNIRQYVEGDKINIEKIFIRIREITEKMNMLDKIEKERNLPPSSKEHQEWVTLSNEKYNLKLGLRSVGYSCETCKNYNTRWHKCELFDDTMLSTDFCIKWGNR